MPSQHTISGVDRQRLAALMAASNNYSIETAERFVDDIQQRVGVMQRASVSSTTTTTTTTTTNTTTPSSVSGGSRKRTASVASLDEVEEEEEPVARSIEAVPVRLVRSLVQVPRRPGVLPMQFQAHRYQTEPEEASRSPSHVSTRSPSPPASPAATATPATCPPRSWMDCAYFQHSALFLSGEASGPRALASTPTPPPSSSPSTSATPSHYCFTPSPMSATDTRTPVQRRANFVRVARGAFEGRQWAAQGLIGYLAVLHGTDGLAMSEELPAPEEEEEEEEVKEEKKEDEDQEEDWVRPLYISPSPSASPLGGPLFGSQ